MQQVLDGPKFKKRISTDAIRFVSVTSEDGKASTIIFDDFSVETGTGNLSEPDVVTRKFTYVRQIESSEDCCVEQDFRGFIQHDANASAAMIVHSGSQATVVDLIKSIEDARNGGLARDYPTYKQTEQAATEAGFDDSPRESISNDFIARILTLVPAGQSLQTTVILLVNGVGGKENSGAFLSLDSIDSEIKAKPDMKN